MAKLAVAGAWYLIRMKTSEDRLRIRSGKDSAIFHAASATPANTLTDSKTTERAIAYRGAFAFALRGGVPLGDATIGQIRDEIALRYRLSRENEVVAKWLEGVLDKALQFGADDKTILRNVVDSEAISTEVAREPEPQPVVV